MDNIAYEVFSPFAAAFESVRKARQSCLLKQTLNKLTLILIQVEIEFFLAHWHEIRTSDTMKNVWVQIRNGRHPGFEDGVIDRLNFLFKI